jgi:hypothetical protein
MIPDGLVAKAYTHSGCRKLGGKGGQLQILLCPMHREATAAGGLAEDQSAGPSLEGLGLASAPGTPVATAQQAAVPSDPSADGATAAESMDGRSDAHAAALASMPPAVAAIVQQQRLAPVPVQVGWTCLILTQRLC